MDVTPEILQQAYESFMRGLFRSTQDTHTRICIGKEPRPYVCPFRTSGRGAHRTFANVDRLVRTAVPWVIDVTAHRIQRTNETKKLEADRISEQKKWYERMPTPKLLELRDRMDASVKGGSIIGWTMSLPELEQQLRMLDEVLKDRKDV